MRYLRFISAFLAICLYQGCSNEPEPDFIEISGRVITTTGQPLAGVHVQLCKGTHFGNEPAQINEKKLLGTTDACGNFIVEIDPAEAGYTVHADKSDGVVLNFEHCSYGHQLQVFTEGGDYEMVLARPFLDSVRWFFDSSNLIIEVRSNSVGAAMYHALNETSLAHSYDVIEPNNTLELWEVADGLPTSSVATIEDAPTDGWVSFIFSNIEPNKAYNYYVSGGNGIRSIAKCLYTDLGQFIHIRPTERPLEYIYVLPEEDSCAE
jgi:hypothetical protein